MCLFSFWVGKFGFGHDQRTHDQLYVLHCKDEHYILKAWAKSKGTIILKVFFDVFVAFLGAKAPLALQHVKVKVTAKKFQNSNKYLFIDIIDSK